MDLDTTSDSSDSSEVKYWVDEFLLKKGNEFFCNVDEEFILDKFNLTGLVNNVLWFSNALDIITDKLDVGNLANAQTREALRVSACHLYGLIHARYIVTARGLQKMADKLRHEDFGTCPRALCKGSPVVPIGLHDEPGESTVKLYCLECQDIYNPTKSSSRRANLDGAYWGTSFPHLLAQAFPILAIHKTPLTLYIPKLFGFRVHEQANLQRERLKLKDKIMRQRRQRLLSDSLNADSQSRSLTKEGISESDEDVEENMVMDPEMDCNPAIHLIESNENPDQSFGKNDKPMTEGTQEEKMEEGSQEGLE